MGEKNKKRIWRRKNDRERPKSNFSPNTFVASQVPALLIGRASWQSFSLISSFLLFHSLSFLYFPFPLLRHFLLCFHPLPFCGDPSFPLVVPFILLSSSIFFFHPVLHPPDCHSPHDHPLPRLSEQWSQSSGKWILFLLFLFLFSSLSPVRRFCLPKIFFL